MAKPPLMALPLPFVVLLLWPRTSESTATEAVDCFFDGGNTTRLTELPKVVLCKCKGGERKKTFSIYDNILRQVIENFAIFFFELQCYPF